MSAKRKGKRERNRGRGSFKLHLEEVIANSLPTDRTFNGSAKVSFIKTWEVMPSGLWGQEVRICLSLMQRSLLRLFIDGRISISQSRLILPFGSTGKTLSPQKVQLGRDIARLLVLHLMRETIGIWH